MIYRIKITPIASNTVYWKGDFQTEQEAWDWTEENNCPYVDYDVIAFEEEPPDENDG